MHSFHDLEPVCCSMSSFNCCFLTCIQISQEASKVVWYSHLFQNFPQFTVILSPCLFNLHAEYTMQIAGLDEAQAGIKIARRNINNLRYADDTTLNGIKWRGTKELLEESERREWKSWLKTQNSKNKDHGIRSHHFMANRQGNNGNSGWLYFGGAPKSLQMVTAAMKFKDAYSLEGKLWPT